MQSKELQTLTASEPLTLEEEYAMQGMGCHFGGSTYSISLLGWIESWLRDEDSEFYTSPHQTLYLKGSLELTFIILAREDPPTRELLTSEDIACLRMIGDVNLFVKECEKDEEEGQSHVVQEGEIEVMIAGMPLWFRLFHLLTD